MRFFFKLLKNAHFTQVDHTFRFKAIIGFIHGDQTFRLMAITGEDAGEGSVRWGLPIQLALMTIVQEVV